MLPFFRLLHNNKQQNNSATSNPPRQSLKLKGDGNNVNQSIVIGAQPPTLDQLEEQRFNTLVAQLRQQWLLSSDRITLARLAGLEWGAGEREFVDQELQNRGIFRQT